MPHTRHTNSSGDDLGSTDEVKVFKDEGDREDEKISSENLLEEKSSLIDLTESEEKSSKISARSGNSPVFGKIEPHTSTYNMGYLVSPYPYSNGSAGGLPVSMTNKIGLPCFFSHNGDHLTTPPPAHCGIPPYQLDAKSIGMSRPAIYPFPSSQYHYSIISPDISQVGSWHTPSVYSAASSFRSPYPTSLPINTALSGDFSFRFSPNLLPSVHTSQHHMLSTHNIIPPPGAKADSNLNMSTSHRYAKNMDNKSAKNLHVHDNSKEKDAEKKKAHIKKPLNAFMLYMKEMRAKVVAECTLKESAAINQILGRRWHELSREEQSKYYEKARQERQLHMELYPGWSARDNYGYVSKKKKRKKDRSPTDSGGNNMKKCRARFGLDQQNQWCKPCKRKKKCIRYMEAIGINCNSVKEENYNDIDDVDGQRSDDDENENMGSCDSGDDNTKTYDDDNESLNQSLSSPSGFSSFQSPPISLASPAIAQQSNGSLSISDHNKHNQNFHCLQSQNSSLHQHNKMHQHFPQSIPMSSLCPTSSGTYDGGSPIICTSSNISNLISTLTSPSSTPAISMAGYVSTNACSTNTTSATLPASLSDRMMRSLLTNSPSMLLGNRLSHLAMGLAMTNNMSGNGMPGNISSIDNENLTNLSNIATIAENDMKTSATAPLPPISSHQFLSVTGFPRIRDADKSHSSAEIGQTKSSKSSPISTNPVITEACTNINNKNSNNSLPLQRSPIGANPRDINNPLSINQLTKRPHEDSNILSSVDINSISNTKESSLITSAVGHVLVSGDMASFNPSHSTQQPTQSTLVLPTPTHSAIFSDSQHFQQKFNQHLVTAATTAATSTSSSISSHTTQTTEINYSISSGVSRRSSTETTSNESGAINVT